MYLIRNFNICLCQAALVPDNKGWKWVNSENINSSIGLKNFFETELKVLVVADELQK